MKTGFAGRAASSSANVNIPGWSSCATVHPAVVKIQVFAASFCPFAAYRPSAWARENTLSSRTVCVKQWYPLRRPCRWPSISPGSTRRRLRSTSRVLRRASSRTRPFLPVAMISPFLMAIASTVEFFASTVEILPL